MAANTLAAGMVANTLAAGMVANTLAAGMVAADTLQALLDRAGAGIFSPAGETRATGCSATAPLPTPHCNRSSGRRGSTAGFQVRPGLGGVVVLSSAGSDRCSGPTPSTTCSITFTGHMPMTTSGPTPTMMSTTASTVLTPIAVLTLTAPMPVRTDTMPAGARGAA